MRFTTLIAFLLLLSLAFADFRLEKAEIIVSDIDKEGGARIQEIITFLISGELSYSLYDSGLYNNDLSFWAATTQLTDAKLHLNPNKVDIEDFRLIPQPRKGCNVFANSCRGQLIIEYKALPHYSKEQRINGTGLFFVKREKPRTTTYRINSEALSFTTTNIGDIIINGGVTLKIIMPKTSTVTELNPFPENVEVKLPQQINELSWTNTILVRFVLAFQVEESLGNEVTAFFTDLSKTVERVIRGEHGLAVILILLILVGGYIYLSSLKYKKEK